MEPLGTAVRHGSGLTTGIGQALHSPFFLHLSHSLWLPCLRLPAIPPPSRRAAVLPPAGRMCLYKWNNRTNKN